MRTITTEPARVTVDGQPAVANLPVIPADAPPQLREGLRRRRVAALRGRCPCGARRGVSPFPLAPRVAQSAEARQLATAAGSPPANLPFQHLPECPAHEALLGAAIADWQAAGGDPGVAHSG